MNHQGVCILPQRADGFRGTNHARANLQPVTRTTFSQHPPKEMPPRFAGKPQSHPSAKSPKLTTKKKSDSEQRQGRRCADGRASCVLPRRHQRHAPFAPHQRTGVSRGNRTFHPRRDPSCAHGTRTRPALRPYPFCRLGRKPLRIRLILRAFCFVFSFPGSHPTSRKNRQRPPPVALEHARSLHRTAAFGLPAPPLLSFLSELQWQQPTSAVANIPPINANLTTFSMNLFIVHLHSLDAGRSIPPTGAHHTPQTARPSVANPTKS